MTDVNILLLRLKYALESMDEEEQLLVVNHIESVAAGVKELKSRYNEETDYSSRLN